MVTLKVDWTSWSLSRKDILATLFLSLAGSFCLLAHVYECRQMNRSMERGNQIPVQ